MLNRYVDAPREWTMQKRLRQAQAENERLRNKCAELDDLYLIEQAGRQQTETQVARLEEGLKVVVTALKGDHRKIGGDCTEGPCAVCWAEGTAEAVLAEGNADACPD